MAQYKRNPKKASLSPEDIIEASYPIIQRKLWELGGSPKYVDQLVQLLPELTPEVRARALNDLIKSMMEWEKIKISVEARRESNLALLGLKETINPNININLSSLNTGELAKLLEAPSELVSDQTPGSVIDVPAEIGSADEGQGSQGEGSLQTVGIKVGPNLYVGSASDLKVLENWAYIHFCKSWHRKYLNYDGNLDKSHKSYYFAVDREHLYANIVDADKPIFAPQVFKKALDFITLYAPSTPVFIHCDKGQSRSPTLALLYLLQTKVIVANTWEDAVEEFKKVYPNYRPGKGITEFMKLQWQQLLKS